jgi:hypothetical protein
MVMNDEFKSIYGRRSIRLNHHFSPRTVDLRVKRGERDVKGK